jgi:hypothetical protein
MPIDSLSHCEKVKAVSAAKSTNAIQTDAQPAPKDKNTPETKPRILTWTFIPKQLSNQ